MRLPVGIAQLVGDQGIGCFRIGHAQKGLRQCQQGDAFLRVQPILVQELVDPARGLRPSQISEQAARACDDALAFVGRGGRALQQRFQDFAFLGAVKAAHERRCGIHGF